MIDVLVKIVAVLVPVLVVVTTVAMGWLLWPSSRLGRLFAALPGHVQDRHVAEETARLRAQALSAQRGEPK